MKRFALAGALLASASALPVVLGQIDTFEDGTVMEWEGNFLMPPANVATGGPRGVNDNYLKVEAGTGGGLHLACFNREQWAGNWTAAGVKVVEAHIKNDGPDPIAIRGVWFTAGGTRVTSSVSIAVPADGVWRKIAIPCRTSDLVVVLGGETVSQVLAATERFMIRHDAGDPGSQGEEVHAIMGVDNIEASNKADFQPTSFINVRGPFTGTLQDLFFSDDLRLEHKPGVTLVTSLAPVEFRLRTNVQLANPTALSFNVECHATSASIRRQIALLNHTSGQFEIVSPYSANTTTDSLVTVAANPALYVHPATGLIEARIQHDAFGPVLIYPWRTRHDRVFFRLTP